jgi:hypothetical protein
MGTTTAAISSSPSTSTSTKPCQNTGAFGGTKGLPNIMLNQLVDKTMITAVKEK